MGTYWAIFGVVLSTLFVPLPEELALLGAGYVARQGVVTVVGAYLCALAAVLLGDTITFALGRGLLPKFLRTRLGKKVIKPSIRRWAENLVQRHELRAILLGRFLVALRGPVYLAIGAAKLPAWKFTAVNSAVAVLEVAAIVALGYAFGASHELAHDLRWLEIVIGVTLVLVLVVIPFFVKRRIERRQPA
ncbi:MAG TPA: DedA family protein [Myxococcales bacterium]|jgi:membrane protein DedA with SNARE-associated domain|nr:DedA family protein [Myxococcales bacterium]